MTSRCLLANITRRSPLQNRSVCRAKKAIAISLEKITITNDRQKDGQACGNSDYWFRNL
jgi:hypothetical protein